MLLDIQLYTCIITVLLATIAAIFVLKYAKDSVRNDIDINVIISNHEEYAAYRKKIVKLSADLDRLEKAQTPVTINKDTPSG